MVEKARISVFNYDQIPVGYYHHAMVNGRPSQRFWHRKKFEAVAAELPATGPFSVLDIGCGPGSFLSVLCEVTPDVTAVGVDISGPQVAFARELAAQSPAMKNASFVSLGNPNDPLPFENESFDFVTSIEIIEHIHPYWALSLLREARRVLRPTGRLILTTPNYHSIWPLIEHVLEKVSTVKYHEQHISRFTPNSLAKFIESAGFIVESMNSIFKLSPFVAEASWSLAERLHGLEHVFAPRRGNLLICSARKHELLER